MASIYFYYNELLRQSADQAATSSKNAYYGHEDVQAATAKSLEKKRQGSSFNPTKTKTKEKENQDDDGAPKAPFGIHADTEATLAALQPRMNRLAYLQTAGTTNLDALTRSLGPKL
ncbi:hypothetical protein PHYPSEUDO_000784 [Phytophthora pseudosyringae]|uniref:Uncharacterized protein n=1 Tax=Phytophthora pseudosyringae TaxID=221518 RepID=A0A8T1WG38_9STRA|nr:hypothetical protein PHYPSEUDO_000784 [Phytophthora pseudosyringae]